MKINHSLSTVIPKNFEQNTQKINFKEDTVILTSNYNKPKSQLKQMPVSEVMGQLLNLTTIPEHKLSYLRTQEILTKDSIKDSEDMENMRYNLLKNAVKDNNRLAIKSISENPEIDLSNKIKNNKD